MRAETKEKLLADYPKAASVIVLTLKPAESRFSREIEIYYETASMGISRKIFEAVKADAPNACLRTMQMLEGPDTVVEPVALVGAEIVDMDKLRKESEAGHDEE